MFVLRKIFGNGVENNYALGEHYQLILKETNSLEFDSLSKQVFDTHDDECYGENQRVGSFKSHWIY